MNLAKTSSIMIEMYNKAIEDSRPNYNSPLNQLQFLKLLTLIANPKKILELGVFRGLSTLAIGEGIRDPEAKIISCDITNEYLSDYVQYWQKAKIDHLIDLKIGEANNILDSLIYKGQSETFDFTYIDANKSAYLDYYEKTLKLTKAGGIIIIDNILWKGDVAEDEIQDNFTNIMRKLNILIKNDYRVDSVLIAIEDGIWLLRKR
jgi:caffeoyl-CoA O-methyltransferase